MGFSIALTSQKPPAYVDSQVEKFLQTADVCVYDDWTCIRFLNVVFEELFLLQEILKNMTTEDFENHKKNVKDNHLAKIQNMDDLATFYWDEISDQTYNFELRDVQVEHLLFIRKTDMLKFFKVKEFTMLKFYWVETFVKHKHFSHVASWHFSRIAYPYNVLMYCKL